MAYRDRYKLKPLRVRAWLRTGVVADEYLPLDGILLYQAHRDLHGAQEMTIPGEYTRQGISTLPLGIANPGRKGWYYQCSWAQWSHEIEGKDHWNKRFDTKYADLVDFAGRRGKVIVEQGRYRAFHMPVFYRCALWIDWYCIGDEKEIAYLLSTVTHMGKKAAQGWGRITRWEIERADDDWSVWRDDVLTRGIPAEEAAKIGGSFRFQNYGIRPSYWKSNNQMLLAMPGGQRNADS